MTDNEDPMIDADTHMWVGTDPRAERNALITPETTIREWKRTLRSNKSLEYPMMEIVGRRTKVFSSDVAVSRRLTYAALILSELIEINKKKAGGAPVLKGTRFKVAQLLGELADGHALSKIAKEFGLDRETLARTLHAMAIQLDRSFTR